MVERIKREQVQSARSKEALAAVDSLLNMTEQDWEFIRQKGKKLKQKCRRSH